VTATQAAAKRCIVQRCVGWMTLEHDPEDPGAAVYSCSLCGAEEFGGYRDGHARPVERSTSVVMTTERPKTVTAPPVTSAPRWVEFRPGSACTVTIGKNAINISVAALEALGSPERLVVLFEPTRRWVGLRPASGKAGLRVPTNRQITVRAFLEQYKILPARRLPARFEDGVLVVELPRSEAVPK
jgi:hypothetical protein